MHLSGYHIFNQIYESNNSLVYRAKRNSDNQLVILKVLKQEYPTPEQLTRYKREYDITQSLKIEGVSKAYSLQKYKNTLVIILEDFGGESLKKLLSSYNFSVLESLKIAIRIAEILTEIHAQNIIHKDITSDNIVFNIQTNEVKIIDFGISTILLRENPTLKNPRVLEGTLAYISPEQTGRMNRCLDYRSDFYSFGVTLYELLTHQLPFDASDAIELVHCHIAKQPVPPHYLNPDVPQTLSNIVMKLLAKTAENRYQSGWGIQADLRVCLTQLETSGKVSNLTLGQQDISEKFQIPQKLYGREREVETLLTAFERVAANLTSLSTEKSLASPINDLEPGKAEIMLVSGYSGIGKSALVQEIYKPITRNRGYFISGKFDQFQRNIPYSAIATAFQSLIRQLLTESESILSQWQTKIQQALGFNAQIIIDVIPEVELIIGSQPAVQKLGPAESQNRFNLVFQNFIRVFCAAAHPLVIFLDDLQWADSATLKLIEIIISDEEMRYLFLIGAYRDNEVDATHPLMMTLHNLRNKRAIINQITLTPLKLEHVTQLIAETLHSNTEAVKPLASLILSKTQGNPFFVNQFLKTLYLEKLLTFNLPTNYKLEINSQLNFQSSYWTWDIAQIADRDITDNVVDLMIKNLKKLPSPTQKILQLAACVGNRFDLTTLAIISQASPASTFQNLLPAIQAGLILPTSDFKTTSLEIVQSHIVIYSFKFLHDRVQQSAYALIEDNLKKSVHLQIGQLLLNNLSPEQCLERVFEIVDHFNLGQELITEKSQKIELLNLNLAAARKAKDAMAYAAARLYLMTAMSSFTNDSWVEYYELALMLHKERAEVEYLNGNFERSQALIQLILSQAKTAIEKAEVYNMLIVQYTLLSKYNEAIQAGRQALSLLGIDLPEKQADLEAALVLELAEANSYLKDREISLLINQEKMQAPEQKVALKLLGNMGPLTFFSHQALWKITVVKAINLSFKYGFVAGGSYCYSCYGIILSSILGDYQSGYEFGLLSLQLSDLAHNLAQNCQDSVIFANYLNCWLNHIKTTAHINNEGYQTGLQSGNLQWAGYNRMFQAITLFYQGLNLEQLLAEINTFILFCQKTKNKWSTDIILANQLAILNLLGQTDEARDAKYLESFRQRQSMAAICEYHVLKAQVFYIYEQYEQALKWATSALEILDYLMGHISSSHHYFYYSLILTALYPSASASDQQRYWQIITDNQKQMQIWAEQCPENFLHKYLLIEAEIAHISGKVAEAMELYDRAIESAKEHEFIQNEALASELAAKFWLTKGKDDFAKIYLTKAHYSYQLWGAKGKVTALENKYSELLSIRGKNQASDTNHSSTATTVRVTNSLDLTTVVKASQAISSEIVLSSLLDNLMTIVMENAGAQQGFFITKQNNTWEVEVEATFDEENTTVLLPIVPQVSGNLPLSILNYVERTREDLVIDVATSEQRFMADPYIVEKQPKSILCSPIIYRGRLNGILYLENNLTTGAFTAERLKILNLLTAQVSISLENAKLYTGLQAYSQQLEAKNLELLDTNKKLEAEIAERKQAASALRESEERLQAILNNSTAVIFVKDLQGKYILINRQFANLFGLNPQEFQGKTDYDFLPSEIADALRLNDRQVLTTGTPLEIEEEVPQADGLRTYLSIKVPLYEADGSIYAVCGISTDITERKQVEAQIREFNETLETQVQERTVQLEAANKELDSFSYSVSHDLRAPLRHIGGFVNALEQYLERSGSLNDPKVTHYIKVIRDSSKKMGDLIDGLLTLSRLGRRTLQKHPVNLLSLVETAIALVQSNPLVADQSIEFTIAELPIVMADATLLQQVFSNLIDNAVKFSRHCSPARISVGILDDKTIFIKDNGVGFDMDYADQLFGAFQRLHSDKAFEGTGIGLAIVQRIIHRHGGKIWAESQLDIGTTFYFKLDDSSKGI